MLIRTQNRKTLVDITNLVIEISRSKLISKNSIIAYHTNDFSSSDYITLGTYSTEEKALKVLDMIQKTYESTTSQLSINGFLITQCNKVFEMPADEDIDKEE